MKKNGFTTLDFINLMIVVSVVAVVIGIGVLMLMLMLMLKESFALKAESGGNQKVPTYRITTFWEDKESGCAEFYIEGLIKDPNTVYVSCLSQARREIEANGYDVKIEPALYEGGIELRAIWVIAEKKK